MKNFTELTKECAIGFINTLKNSGEELSPEDALSVLSVTIFTLLKGFPGCDNKKLMESYPKILEKSFKLLESKDQS